MHKDIGKEKLEIRTALERKVPLNAGEVVPNIQYERVQE